MEIIATIAGMGLHRESWRKQGREVGLVPTMGFLHEGHLSLIKRARVENEKVVVTSFVNPLQFGKKEEVSLYPRDFSRDFSLLGKEKVDLVFCPTIAEMYPEGFDSFLEVGQITHPLEGNARPGHFKGVTTVVAKLFNLVGAQRAYFGQKDAQQTLVIKKMVRDLNFPLEIIVCPTLRENDGLAMSSRNVFLNPEERRAAPILVKALNQAKIFWISNPENRSGPELRKVMEECLAETPLARPEYTSAADPENLSEYEGKISPGKGVLLSLAVRFGNTRLIDNFLLEG